MSTTVLHEQIADDLLAQLSDEDFSAWSDVRRRLPGDLQTQGQVLTSLFERGEVYCIKIAGRNCPCLRCCRIWRVGRASSSGCCGDRRAHPHRRPRHRGGEGTPTATNAGRVSSDARPDVRGDADDSAVVR